MVADTGAEAPPPHPEKAARLLPRASRHRFDPIYGNMTLSPNPGWPMVAIRGAYHTGTSWLRSLFTANAVGTEYARMVYGHKHSNFTAEHAATLRRHPRHVMVFVYRGVFVWLPKMKKNSYSSKLVPQRRTARAQRPSRVAPGRKASARAPFDVFLRTPHMVDADVHGAVAAKATPTLPNFVAMRNRLYGNFVAASDAPGRGKGAAQTDNVTYEAVVADQCEVVRGLLARHGIETTSSCTRVDGYTKYGKTTTKGGAHRFDPTEELDPSRFMTPYTLDDVRYVLDRLDPALERRLGFSYLAEQQWCETTFGTNATATAWQAYRQREQAAPPWRIAQLQP